MTRAKHYTIHPIIHLINHCAEYTLGVFDLSTAFDVINHKIFLHKLQTYRIRGLANDWLSSSLKQDTIYGNR